MKYKNMVKFLNDNDILVMQVVIANEVDNMTPIGFNLSDDEFEQVCEIVYANYINNCMDTDIDIRILIKKELDRLECTKRANV